MAVTKPPSTVRPPQPSPRVRVPPSHRRRPIGAGGEPIIDRLSRRAGLDRIPHTVLDAVVLGVIFGVLLSYLRPGLLLSQTTATGGDTGAQIYPPWYLMTHLLSRGQISGWSPGWFAGFPVLQFYFPLVPTIQALLGHIIPFTMAFKIGTVLGTFFLPVAVYMAFRILRLTFPTPAIGALCTLPFLLAKSFTIYGGNIASSLSGEYAFSLSLGLCVVFAALAYRAVLGDRGRPVLAAGVLALAVLSHLLPVVPVIVFAPFLAYWGIRAHGIRATAGRLALMYGLAVALAAFWVVPFVARLGYTSSLRWRPLEGLGLLAPRELWLWEGLAVCGVALAVVVRDRRILVFVVPAAAGVAGFLLIGHGSVWNARFLPFWYLGVVLAAAYAIGGAISIAASVVARARPSRVRDGPLIAVGAVGALVLVLAASAVVGKKLTFVDAWAAGNYGGYETRSGYPQFHALMGRIARLPPGRVMWEPSRDYNAEFGTSDALMTIPYFADHPSMEGLHYESSLTTPFHFLMAAEVADKPFNPIPGLPYSQFDLGTGTQHMQLFGVRYYVAWSDRAKEAAQASKRLRPVGDVGSFAIFEVADAAQVGVPPYRPVVLEGADWEEANIRWFTHPQDLGTPLVADGPEGWTRVTGVDGALPRRPLAHGGETFPAHVEDEEISFTTNAIGEPHWIKTSYFPNWRVDGARGPFLASPSLMMVIPTQHHVRLTYQRTWAEWTGLALTISALLGLAGMWLWRGSTRLRALGAEAWKRASGLDRATVHRLARFGVVSVVATVLDLGSFNVMLHTPFPLLAAATLSYCAGLVASYGLNRSFVFPGRRRSSRREEMAIFAVVSLLGLGLSTGGVALAASVFGEAALLLSLAKIVAAALTWFLKFLAIHRWVFPPTGSGGADQPAVPAKTSGFFRVG
jgi:putative flippase GtrA